MVSLGYNEPLLSNNEPLPRNINEPLRRNNEPLSKRKIKQIAHCSIYKPKSGQNIPKLTYTHFVKVQEQSLKSVDFQKHCSTGNGVITNAGKLCTNDIKL